MSEIELTSDEVAELISALDSDRHCQAIGTASTFVLCDGKPEIVKDFPQFQSAAARVWLAHNMPPPSADLVMWTYYAKDGRTLKRATLAEFKHG